MMIPTSFFSLAAVSACLAVVQAEEYAKLSPFEAVRWASARPEVQVRSTWHGLAAIDGVSIDAILAFAKGAWPDKWVKRFEEDLVELMTRMGHAPGTAASLGLVDLASGTETTISEIPWTEANRWRIWMAAKESDRPNALNSVKVERVMRDHATRPSREYADLARWLPLESGRSLSRAELEADLDQLEWLIEHRFAYRDLAGVDWRAALDAVRLGASEGAEVDAFALQLARLLALFGDGHTRVRGRADWTPEGYLPLQPVASEGRVLALAPEAAGLLDALHPVLARIDGLPLERWLESASLFAPRGNSRAALDWVPAIALLRATLSRAPSATVEVTLTDLSGENEIVRSLSLVPYPPARTEREPLSSREIEGGIGYLRIARMEDDEEFLAGLDGAMQSLRDTTALVIDLRANGGGSRAALRRLLPYFMDESASQLVVNAAAPRVEGGRSAQLPDDLLADRGLYRVDAPQWTESQRAFLEAWVRSFRPRWKLDPELFGPLHVALVDRDENPRAFHYEKPVALLQDEGSFSATDVFLGAFAELPRATLVGTGSGGGSGRPRGGVLAHSGLEVLLSSMASFRPNGELYDQGGIQPDVLVEATAADWAAGRDAALARACELLLAER